MRTIGIIPARRGSKRLPGKNMATCYGKPLIAWTLEAALASDLDAVVVTTDDPLVRDYCAPYCEVIPRPPALATDDATSEDVIAHVLSLHPGYDRVMLLQPTSPLRTVEDINLALWYDTCVSTTRNGAIYLMFADRLMDFYHAYEMRPEDSIDIDDAHDLAQAELALARRGHA